MVTGLICTDSEHKIQDVSNPLIWEELYDLPVGVIEKDKNILEILFQSDFFKDEIIQSNFKKGLESLVTGEKPRLLTKKEDSTVEIYFLHRQFFYITDQVASSYLADSEHAHDLIVNPLVTGGLLVKIAIDLCDSPKPNIGTIKAKITAALREIKLAERLNYDIPVIQNLAHGRFVVLPQSVQLNEGIIEPIKEMFTQSYGERKISIKYDASLDEEVELMADRAGMLFIMRSLFAIPVINSRLHDFRKFYVSYGYEREKRQGRDMHVVVYWAEWPFGLSDKEKEKILNTTEHATTKDHTGTAVPHIGLKYSRNIAIRHGGDIEIQHIPDKKPKPTTEFRLYLPVKQENT